MHIDSKYNNNNNHQIIDNKNKLQGNAVNHVNKLNNRNFNVVDDFKNVNNNFNNKNDIKNKNYKNNNNDNNDNNDNYNNNNNNDNNGSNNNYNNNYNDNNNNTLQNFQLSIDSINQELFILKQNYNTIIMSNKTTSNNNNSIKANSNLKKDINHNTTSTTTNNNNNNLDWKIAISDFSLKIKTEMADKTSREETLSLLRDEVNNIDEKFLIFENKIEKNNTLQLKEVSKLENEIKSIINNINNIKLTSNNNNNNNNNSIENNIISSRFLWTTGKLISNKKINTKNEKNEVFNYWLPWDIQVNNTSPSTIIWKKNSEEIIIRVPGLYKLCIAIFANFKLQLQVYLNDEPLFSLQSNSSNSFFTNSTNINNNNTNNTTIEWLQKNENNLQNSIVSQSQQSTNHNNNNNNNNNNNSNNNNSINSFPNSQQKYENNVVLKRYPHSAGEVTSIGLNENISLPSDSVIKVRYIADVPAQAFLSIKKL
jgi:hypothetical protein